MRGQVYALKKLEPCTRTDNDNRQYRNRVDITVDSESVKYVKNFVPISDRVVLIKLHRQSFNICLL